MGGGTSADNPVESMTGTGLGNWVRIYPMLLLSVLVVAQVQFDLVVGGDYMSDSLGEKVCCLSLFA